MTFRHFTAVLVLLLLGAAAFAQTTSTAAPAPAPATAQTTPPAPDAAAQTALDSRETRRELDELLRRLPPEVGKMLKLDPTLWANESWMAKYPDLVQFVRAHPEVPNSPSFYLESVWIPEDPTPQSAAYDAWKEMMGSIAAFAAFLVITGTLVWLVKTIIDQKRWNRLAATQSEVHGKLLDRFSTNEELIAYVQSPAGKNFLESAPIALEAPGRAIAPPVGRMLWSLQVGIIVASAGLGLMVVSHTIEKQMVQPIFAMGVLAIATGLGFVISAVISYVVSRRLGLWEEPAKS